jgi:hypothetical protein
MAVHIDTSRSPRGELVATTLVEAVAEVGDFAEHHYLEVKGPIDLYDKKNRAKIAKFILGAANRMPEKAASAFEGCAVLIIGVSAAGIEGIPQIEVMEISKLVAPFLGASGPAWDAYWVSIKDSSNKVLVLAVEPPRYGQGPYICRANGADLSDGAIYIRGDGETRPVRSDELDLLIGRGTNFSSPEVDFEVRILGEIRPISLDRRQILEAHIERSRTYLLNALESGNQSQISASSLLGLYGASSALASMNAFMYTPEDRTEDEYRNQIDEWERRFRTAWRASVRTLIGYSLPSMAVQLKNRTRTFFHDVEVSLHIEGGVVGNPYYGPADELTRSVLQLPSLPRRWGPRPNRTFPDYLIPNYAGHNYPASSPVQTRLTWRNTKSIDVTLDVGDFRPLASEVFDEEEVVLLLVDGSQESVHATWQITARDFNDVFSGEFDVPVGAPLDLTSIFNRLLNPDEVVERDEQDIDE